MTKRQKTAFGEFLVQEIKSAGMSQEAFYNAVGIAKPTFYGLITAAPPPPELQYRMLSVLEEKTGKDLLRRKTLLDLAAQGRREIPADIRDVLMDNSDKWDVVRKLLVSTMDDKTTY